MFPRFGVVGDTGEPAANLDGSGQLALLFIDSS